MAVAGVTPFWILTALAIGSAVATILAEFRGAWRAVYVFKPLTMGLVILAAFDARLEGRASGEGAPGIPLFAILAAMLFSTIGDVFLMLREIRFVAGLAAFLVAHLWYGLAFGIAVASASPAGLPSGIRWPAAVVLLAYGVLMYRLLWRGLGRLAVPVAAYMLVIVAMAVLALSAWHVRPDSATQRVVFGALLFVASDSLLAYDKFRSPLPARAAWVLGTYFAAQWFFAYALLP